MEDRDIPKIGISIGDINGIGPEVIIKALSSPKINKICTPIIYGSGKHLSKYKSLIGFNEWQFTGIHNIKNINRFPDFCLYRNGLFQEFLILYLFNLANILQNQVN